MSPVRSAPVSSSMVAEAAAGDVVCSYGEARSRRRPGLRERVDPAGDSPDPVVETRGRVADLGARSSGDGGILRERRSL